MGPIKSLILSLPILFFSYCGTNTKNPVYPLLTVVNPVAPPTIVSVTPVQITTPSLEIKIEFDLDYYVTNQEPEFIGYNLYISTASTSTQSNMGASLYLPNGNEPSFPHQGDSPSTASTDLITQRVTNLKPPPSPIAFTLCEKYYFRMQAVTRNGVYSAPGNQVAACAIADVNQCPKGSICNP
jgi:hypothetical protein